MAPSVRSKWTFKGMMAPTFAPFNEDGSLNCAVIPKYAQYLHDNGVTGVFVAGSMGEGGSLTLLERKALTEAWMKCKDVAGDVVIQVGGTNIEDIKDLARHAESLGVAGICTFPPLYDKPPAVEDLVHYCKEIADAAKNTPLLYYHIPFKTGVEFAMDEFFNLAEPAIPSFVGMKFTSMDVEGEGLRALKAAGGVLKVYTGFEHKLTESRKLGFPGAINAIFNFMPLEAGRLFCLAGLPEDCKEDVCGVPLAQRKETIEKLQKKLIFVWEVFRRYDKGFTVSAAKAATLLFTGIDLGPPRSPNRPLSKQDVEALRKDLLANDFIVKK